jgi:serine/threonine protein kinase
MSQEIVQHITKHIVYGIFKIHSCNLQYGILRLDNILINFPSLPNYYNKDTGIIQIADYSKFSIKEAIIKISNADILPSELRTESERLNDSIAPEILFANTADKKSDLWSLGSIIYQLVYGYPPFSFKDKDEYTEKIQSGSYMINQSNISLECMMFINKLLQIDPDYRLDCKEILDHPFLTKHYGSFISKSFKDKKPIMLNANSLNEEIEMEYFNAYEIFDNKPLLKVYKKIDFSKIDFKYMGNK